MELGIHLAEQTLFFLQAILLGAALGLLYDGFRITRLAVKTPDGVVFAEDVLFFALCAVSTFLFLMRTIDGQLRFFILLGAGLGALLYSLTLSIAVMRVSEAIIRVVKGILRFIFRWLLYPIFRMVYWICLQILRPIRFLGRFFKKSAQRYKYRLKIRRKVLYNQLRSVFARKPGKKRKSKHDPQKDES